MYKVKKSIAVIVKLQSPHDYEADTVFYKAKEETEKCLADAETARIRLEHAVVIAEMVSTIDVTTLGSIIDVYEYMEREDIF